MAGRGQGGAARWLVEGKGSSLVAGRWQGRSAQRVGGKGEQLSGW